MSTIVNHGGSCCGVRHIYSMDNSTVAQLEEQIATIDAYPNNGGSATSGRLIEVILSSRQVGEPNPRGETGNRWAPCVAREGGWPAVMQRLGFRLVSRFENKNSGADCYIFHRVPTFKSLTDLPFAWRHEVAPPVTAAGGPGAAARPAGEVWNVGDRIHYAGVNRHANSYGVIARDRGEAAGNNRYDIRFDNGETVTSYTSRHFVRVNINDRPIPVAPAPVPAPVVIATFYANVLQAGMGAFWPTLEAARAAAPRCRQQARIEVLSDGNRRTSHI